MNANVFEVLDLVARWVLPTFTEIRPYVRRALELCLARGVGFGGLIGQGGYPPCQQGGDLRYYQGVLGKIYTSADAGEQFTKAPACARCDFDPYCVGVRRDYVERHGDAELVPFRIAPALLAGATPLSARPSSPQPSPAGPSSPQPPPAGPSSPQPHPAGLVPLGRRPAP